MISKVPDDVESDKKVIQAVNNSLIYDSVILYKEPNYENIDKIYHPASGKYLRDDKIALTSATKTNV
ncbi:MAG: hypothetical protein MZU91_05665 [Desulfosudis oleivorans]|nr:hypothetical protein [Desulfosudis oleivorans]